MHSAWCGSRVRPDMEKGHRTVRADINQGAGRHRQGCGHRPVPSGQENNRQQAGQSCRQ